MDGAQPLHLTWALARHSECIREALKGQSEYEGWRWWESGRGEIRGDEGR